MKQKYCFMPSLVVLALIVPYIPFSNQVQYDQPLHPQVLGAEAPPLLRGNEVLPQKPVGPVRIKDIDFSDIGAKSFLVYDEASKTSLVEQDAQSKRAIASLTKILTALVVYERGNLSDTVTISAVDVVDTTPVLHARVGDIIKISDLVHSMLVGSANDAALVLAHYLENKTSTPIATLMNAQAEELGMHNSHFSNPFGFDSDYNYATADDLEILVSAILNNDDFKQLGRLTSYSFTSQNGTYYRVKATNKLLRQHSDIVAIKTGSTPAAGETMITKITNNGHSFIIIVLASTDREGDTIKLRDHILQAYKWE